MDLSAFDFKAAMFDFDGTITEPGNYEPDKSVAYRLTRLALKMPIAFCTGRQLESFLDHGFETLMDEIPKKFHKDVLKNLHLIAENGSIGYRFDIEANEFKEFYRVAWPEEYISRKKLMDDLNQAVSEYGAVYYKKHRIVVVIRTHDHSSGDIGLISGSSSKIYDICEKVLSDFDKDFVEHLHIGDSGIGVVICPVNGDKDTGIKMFGQFLEKEYGFDLGENYKKIMAVGDHPEKRGNDHYFLNGSYGTPFTVNVVIEGTKFPTPVYNELGELLKGPLATVYLIDALLLMA